MPSGPFGNNGSPFVARPELMESSAVIQRRHKLDPDEYERQNYYLCLLHEAVYAKSDSLSPLALKGQ
jgi:hypothetical protein